MQYLSILGGGSSGAVDECDFVSQWEESVDLRVSISLCCVLIVTIMLLIVAHIEVVAELF